MVQWARSQAQRAQLWSQDEPLSRPARLALVGVLLTPLTLAWDYRLGLSLIEDTITYTPYAENSGFPATYEQVFGATQVLWLLIGAYALARPDLRAGYRSVTVACLAGLLVLVVGVTLALDGLDRYAALAIASTLLPLTAMAGVLLHPDIGAAGIRRLVLILAATTAVVTAGTIAANLVKGNLGERFDLLLFGSPTDTGLVLAMILILLPAARAPLWLSGALAIPLFAGLVLTETRGALIALAAGAWALALLLPGRRRVAVAAASAFIALAIAAFMLLSKRSLLLTDEATDLRRAELDRHWQLLLARPSYGYGLSQQAAPFSTAAHNAVLGIANAAGFGAALLWLTAWIQPVARAIGRRPSIQRAVAVAVLTCALAGWFTTGTEVLLYTPPTNMLPLLIAAALAVHTVARERA